MKKLFTKTASPPPRKAFASFIFTVLFSIFSPSWAISPAENFNSLVAGDDDSGFCDGTFYKARFNNPAGLAFDEAGENIFVADSGNHRIRVIKLKENNDVETLAGTDTIGNADGPLSQATFNCPTRVVVLPESCLAVYDPGSNSIRLIDLKTKNVSTLATGLRIWDMSYRPKDDCLYFSEPSSGKLEKLDLKTLKVSTIFSNETSIPAPQAICIDQNRIYVADSNLPNVYEAEWEDTKSGPETVSFSLVGKCDHVLELTKSEDILYALQQNDGIARVGWPESQGVSFSTQWGRLVNNAYMQLLLIGDPRPMGFIASPQESRKLFIAKPNKNLNSIISVKDYDFDKSWMAFDGIESKLTDFNYPLKKPEGTFRILIAGDSRTIYCTMLPLDEKIITNPDSLSLRMNTFPKQLEFLLNTEAALRGVRTHFEVLELSRRGDALSTYAYYEIPDLVRKYDIDLVMGLVGFSGYTDYFTKPITSKNVPTTLVDPEYLMKPLSDRVPSGVAHDLYERCQKMKIPMPVDLTCEWPLLGNTDPEIHKDLMEMTGRRLILMADEISTLKNSSGKAPQLILFYAPFVMFPNDRQEAFWADLCKQNNFNYWDLTDPFNALEISYFPATDTYSHSNYGVYGHYTAYGNALIARLLAYNLIKSKSIPFDPAKN